MKQTGHTTGKGTSALQESISNLLRQPKIEETIRDLYGLGFGSVQIARALLREHEIVSDHYRASQNAEEALSRAIRRWIPRNISREQRMKFTRLRCVSYSKPERILDPLEKLASLADLQERRVALGYQTEISTNTPSPQVTRDMKLLSDIYAKMGDIMYQWGLPVGEELQNQLGRSVPNTSPCDLGELEQLRAWTGTTMKMLKEEGYPVHKLMGLPDMGRGGDKIEPRWKAKKTNEAEVAPLAVQTFRA